MARNATQQNRDTQPTSKSVLSACANASTSASACAKNHYAFLTDAAFAVSVFVFFSLIAVIFCSISILFSVSALVVVAYRLYSVYRLRDDVRFFVNGYKTKAHPMLTSVRLV